MSVTFSAEVRPACRFAVSCGCSGATALARPYAQYAEAQAAAAAADSRTRTALPGCELPDICPDYPLRAHDVDGQAQGPEVNVHLTNATRLLHLLGLDNGPDTPGPQVTSAREIPGHPEPAPAIPDAADPTSRRPATTPDGQLPAPEFLGRVLLALVLTPYDEGLPGYWAGRHYTGARPSGHLQQRLRELHDLAIWCAAQGRNVVWH